MKKKEKDCYKHKPKMTLKSIYIEPWNKEAIYTCRYCGKKIVEEPDEYTPFVVMGVGILVLAILITLIIVIEIERKFITLVVSFTIAMLICMPIIRILLPYREWEKPKTPWKSMEEKQKKQEEAEKKGEKPGN